ncbi:MAG: hypothetical protein ACC726_04945 [Chloroflexota bacterium]
MKRPLGLALAAVMLLPTGVMAEESSPDSSEFEAAASEYLAAAEWSNARIDELYDDPETSPAQDLLASAQIDEDFLARLSRISFPASVRPEVSALTAAVEESVRLERQWAEDLTDVDVAGRLDALDEEYFVAVTELRSVLGLDPPPGAPAPIEPGDETVFYTGAWVVGPIEVDPLTDSLGAQTYVPARPGSSAKLVVACAEGATDVNINWGRNVTGSLADVKLRIDQGDVLEDQWLVLGESTVQFFAEDLVTSLFGHSELVAGVGADRAIFDITGIEDAVERVRKACRW